MKIAALEQTCDACPSQWEGTLEDGTAFYVRYRGARLRIGFGETVGAAIDQMDAYTRILSNEPLDGYIRWNEVLPHFNQAVSEFYA